MKVLIGCEFSGIVREAFRERGFDAWSCDLLPSEIPSPYHIQRDILKVCNVEDYWDLMVVFPPCTHLASSGARWFAEKKSQQQDAVEFVKQLLAAPIPRIATENPIGVISTKIRKPDQIVIQ